MFVLGREAIQEEDILNIISEDAIANYYFGLQHLPCLINSPFREDRSPSLGFFKANNGHICFRDFADGSSGNIFNAVALLLDTTYNTALIKIWHDIKEKRLDENKIFNSENKTLKRENFTTRGKTKLGVEIRDWADYDIEYWKSYGISRKMLMYAEVYPIKTIFIFKKSDAVSFAADKYAYAYIERKEGDITMKIYQPFNTNGFKWRNNNDKSVIGLWTKIPEYGDKVCICSSLKDALCLWCQTGIPSIYIQGEGFPISKHAQNDLRSRFNNVYICLDNDEPGLRYAEKLSANTGFKNIVLPPFSWGKDISDYYKGLNNNEKYLFKQTIMKLF